MKNYEKTAKNIVIFDDMNYKINGETWNGFVITLNA